MSEQPIGTTIAGYRIESVIGRGGMAVVYRAEDIRLGRKVALKLLTPALSEQEQFKARFMQESRLAASLDHPNIIPIYEAGNADGLLFIVMRYVVGSDLRVALNGSPQLAATRIARLFEQIGDALDAAHQLGLVHRDVKPGNVLLTSVHEQSDHVYLTDFGLTKRASSLTGLTGTGNFLGTIDYVAPEQIAGKPVDARTDIYALGCVLYECLTGQVPFHRDDGAATLWAHLAAPPPPITEVRSDLSPAVDAVVARAMAKTPDERYDSCREMVQELKVALGFAAPVQGARALGGIHPGGLSTAPAVRPPGSEADQQTHILEADPDATRHPSFPPRRQYEDARSHARPDASGHAARYSEFGPSVYTADPDWDSEEQPQEESGDPRSARRRRWLLAAAITLVAALAMVATFVLLPSKHPIKLSHHYVSGNNSVAPFALDAPADWEPKEGPGLDVVLAPAVASVADLFFLSGSGGSWAPVHALLASSRPQTLGLWISTQTTTYDRSSPDRLQKAVGALLPKDFSFTPGYHDRVVGGMPSDEMEGQFSDPQDQTNQLRFVINVVRYTSGTSHATVLVVFFAAPDNYAENRALFDRIRNTMTFRPS